MLSFRGVSRRFGRALALVDVSFDLAPGSLTALVGGNGAGKTTLLRLAAGLDAPSAGSVELAGGTPEATRRKLAWLGERDGLYDELTLRENLAFAATFHGSHARVESAAAAFGMASRLDVRARSLSRGERQRGALARTLLCGDVMLLDEPTTALDADAARACIETLVSLRGARTMLVATHDAELVKRADRSLRLDAGRLAA